MQSILRPGKIWFLIIVGERDRAPIHLWHVPHGSAVYRAIETLVARFSHFDPATENSSRKRTMMINQELKSKKAAASAMERVPRLESAPSLVEDTSVVMSSTSVTMMASLGASSL